MVQPAHRHVAYGSIGPCSFASAPAISFHVLVTDGVPSRAVIGDAPSAIAVFEPIGDFHSHEPCLQPLDS